MKTVIAGALGECVHVAGVTNFLRLDEQAGWRTIFLGPAVSIDEFIETADRENPDLDGGGLLEETPLSTKVSGFPETPTTNN